MANVGILSKDVITKGRLIEAVEEKADQIAAINSGVFDANAFDLILVDLNDPMALLVIKNHGHKCIAFASSSDENKLKAAKMAGCDRVYKHGEFFKKILPNLKLK